MSAQVRDSSILVVLVAAALEVARAQTPSPAAPARAKTFISFADARPVLETLNERLIPAQLRTATAVEREAIWPRWVAGHDEAIRLRLERGDEDSIVNLLLFGVTFTAQPRTSIRDMLTLLVESRGEELIQSRAIQARIEDLIGGIEAPGGAGAGNDRLEFARHVFNRRGLDARSASGRVALRRYLEEGIRRVFEEYEEYFRANARSAPYSGRGLSSDTSLLPNFALDEALREILGRGLLEAGRVRRVAIIGPGLDFADKREGYDFYPQQTLQPFAAIDSLTRLGLAARDGLRVTTLDLSPRINQHLAAARARARRGVAYGLVLPRDLDMPWHADLVAYWKRFGDRIGNQMPAVAPPPSAGRVEVRAVGVRPSVALSIVPEDVNVVLERLDPLPLGERFDLIVATNIFLYYDAFEQALALVNVARMLRPGGLLVTNDPIVLLPATPITAVGSTRLQYTALPNSSDELVWYQRQ